MVFFIFVFALLLGAIWSSAAILPTGSAVQPKPKATPTGPQSDADVQKCIQDKIAASDLKSQNVQVSVSNGQAVLAGDITTPAHKSTAGQIARGCGAHKYILQKRRAG